MVELELCFYIHQSENKLDASFMIFAKNEKLPCQPHFKKTNNTLICIFQNNLFNKSKH